MVVWLSKGDLQFNSNRQNSIPLGKKIVNPDDKSPRRVYLFNISRQPVFCPQFYFIVFEWLIYRHWLISFSELDCNVIDGFRNGTWRYIIITIELKTLSQWGKERKHVSKSKAQLQNKNCVWLFWQQMTNPHWEWCLGIYKSLIQLEK